MNRQCVFCSIVSGAIPSFRIYEDELVVSFLDINPFSKGHALVVPKRHVAGMADCDDELLAETLKRVRKIAVHVVSVLGADGFNVLQNNGEAAGQTVGHLHFHIIPRYAGVPVSFESAPGDMQELENIAGKLKFQI